MFKYLKNVVCTYVVSININFVCDLCKIDKFRCNNKDFVRHILFFTYAMKNDNFFTKL
jgi:hypothetical protein